MTSLQLYLKDGKWFGNEFPEEPIPYGVGDEQYYGARMDEYKAAVEKAKSEALEVSNPEELYFTYKAKPGKLYIKNQNGLGITEVVPGVLYPWDGEWEIVEACGSEVCPDDAGCEHCEKPVKLLRLLLKSPVIPEGSKTVLFKGGKFYGENAPDTLEWETICKWSPGMISNFCSRCMGKCPDKVLRLKEKAVVNMIALGDSYKYLSHVNKGSGIVAIGGIPENDDALPADGKFKKVFEKSSLFKKDVVAIGGIEERGETYKTSLIQENLNLQKKVDELQEQLKAARSGEIDFSSLHMVLDELDVHINKGNQLLAPIWNQISYFITRYEVQPSKPE